MASTELTTAAQRAILERVRSQLSRTEPRGAEIIGIRSPGPPAWDGPSGFEIDGRDVQVAACPSVLAVLDALSRHVPGSILVLLTDRPETDLGDAVLARLHRGKLLDADRYTLLGDLLATRRLDPRIRTEPWLVDALIELAATDALPSTARSTLSRSRAMTLVLTARLGVDSELLDLPSLIGVLGDDAAVRSRWRALAAEERAGLTEHLVSLHAELRRC